ncbi:MAG: hypothetical protein HZC55_04255 [Verrucomicrobia bacterium]|nr:hypothetical protein [Verrucomicrobiota bacterium]
MSAHRAPAAPTRPFKGAPVTAADCDEWWIALRREILVREGQAIRQGAGLTIEVQSINTGRFHPLTLPNDATSFATLADRDAILCRLQRG